MKKRRLRINAAHIQAPGLEMAGQLLPTILDLGDSLPDRDIAAIDYRLHIALVSEELLAKGVVSTIIHGPCDRCLASYGHVITNADICHLVVIPTDKIVDLTEAIREDILIMFPQKYLCNPECRGLCSICGTNLNRGNCNCGVASDPINAWSQLDRLEL